MAKRLHGFNSENTVVGMKYKNGFKYTEHDGYLCLPQRWKKSCKIFVNSMSDTFHENASKEHIATLFYVMNKCPQHTFQLLTKRPENIPNGLNWTKNIHLGVTVCNQEEADKKIPVLLQVPAKYRFLSIEPMLDSIDIGMSLATCDCCDRWNSRWVKLHGRVTSDSYVFLLKKPALFADPGIYRAHSNKHGALSINTPDGLLGIRPREFTCLPKLDLVIVGGESGPGARPMHPDWVRSIRDQCKESGVPFTFKQWGEWCPNNQFDVSKVKNGSLTPSKVLYVNGNGTFSKIGIGKDPSNILMYRVGKKIAGRALDGVTHDGEINAI
jgi:protein gp37